MSVDIRNLQYVLETARLESFTKAAALFHITQPTISKAIQNVENELGVQLFVRSGRKPELTDAGRAFLAQAAPIVHAFENMKSELNDLTNFKKGSIRIGLPPMVGASFFPKIMSRFREAYPGLTIRMVEDGSKKVEAEVGDGSLDVGVVLMPTNEEKFDSFLFVRESLKLILHPAHRLAERTEVALAELAEEPFILFREDFALHDRVIAECLRAGFEPRVIHESSQWDFISEMAAAGLGVALLPETISAALDPARVRAVPLTEPVIPWQLAMIWRKDGYLSYAAREWIRFTRACLTEGR